ncbi:NAD(P)-dependent dehydrogenase (short-subunit alcohol dehydrogenase family) [Thermocatellispora tengchongensis]|uniref:NAD(P)-dependent dehydrogenase (Short-subunit alcohol dehydrogenase family) n=1 Tax=Thermocatellispora tengchongensis TaxID=1073253 RepID=A0A840PK05_9ACTN|nr:oxidoreductase [Thermocatellispora tengchongensis]MBB5136385.1 NAD(P)-dependent dehydrogenase (short-subunit alcohol dehydrogenase family) [Thermocatellispora tengchongensis]
MSKTWLITGSSSGLGRALVEAVLDRGDRVMAASRRPGALDDLADRYGDRLFAVALDVTDAAAVRGVVEDAVTRFGSLDVVVNNAGYATSAAAEDFPEEAFRAEIELNLFGVVNVTRAALPVMRQARSGHIVQISSIGGRVGGTPGLSAYQTAKFGVEGFSEVVANEVAPLGVKVTIVEPGALRTGWMAGAGTTPAPVREEYEQTVGVWLRRRSDYVGKEQGDPVRAARAIVAVVEAEEPPRRLLLGSDALRLALQSAAERTAEAEEWAELTRSSDFPG